jgi:hypothetical protein
MNRAGTPRCCDAHRLGDIAPERRGGFRGPRRLGDRRRHVSLTDFLKAAAAEFPCRRVPREEHHGGFRAKRGEQGADRVGMPRAAGDERDAGFTGEPSPRVRHVHGRRLVPHVHQVELGLERRIEQRHDVIAGEREDVTAAEPLERARDDVRAS